MKETKVKYKTTIEKEVCAVCEAPATHSVTGLVSGTKVITSVLYCNKCVRGELI